MPGKGRRFTKHEDKIASEIVKMEKKRGLSTTEAKARAYGHVNTMKKAHRVATKKGR